MEAQASGNFTVRTHIDRIAVRRVGPEGEGGIVEGALVWDGTALRFIPDEGGAADGAAAPGCTAEQIRDVAAFLNGGAAPAR